MITTIIFDLAEVFLQGFFGIQNKLSIVLKEDPEIVWKKIYGEEFKPYMEGKISEDDFWNSVVKRNNWSFNNGFLKSLVRENFYELDGTRDIIKKLKVRGFKLGLLSDHSREWIDFCHKKFDYHKLFHSTQYSFEVEVCKSDVKAFHLILDRLKEKPESCLFIDDNPNNLKVAKSVGISTIHFISPKQLVEELKSFGIHLD